MVKRLAVLGCLGTAVPVLAVLAGLLVAGDVGARHYATGQLSDRISVAVPEASGVRARIRSFPFLGRIAVNGSISEVGAHVDRVAGLRGVVFSDLDVDLRGVVLDRHEILRHRRVRLMRMRQGTVTVSITAQALSSALGRPTRITGGQVIVTVLGSRTVRGALTVTPTHDLDLQMSPLPGLRVPLPSTKLLPCLPVVAYREGQIDLGCTFTRIPHAFVEVASRAAVR